MNEYEREQEIGAGAMAYTQPLQMDVMSSDSDDIFNDKTIEKLDKQFERNQ